jgi:hypothetical protein
MGSVPYFVNSGLEHKERAPRRERHSRPWTWSFTLRAKGSAPGSFGVSNGAIPAKVTPCRSR